MTFIGKLLIVVNLVFTVCIAMFAAGVHTVQTNWKSSYEATLKNYEDSEENLRQLKNRVQTIQDEHKKELNQLNAEVTRWQKKYEEDLKSFDQVTAQVGSLTNALDRERAKNKLLTTENGQLDQRLKVFAAALKNLHAKQDDLLKEIAQLMDSKHELERQKQQIQKAHGQLVWQYVAAIKKLRSEGITFDPERDAKLTVKPKPAEGLVTAVIPGSREKATLIEISVGKDDGVAEGQLLYVYRLSKDDTRYLGRIEVVYVTADKAVGTVVDDPKNGAIQKGDYVSEKL